MDELIDTFNDSFSSDTMQEFLGRHHGFDLTNDQITHSINQASDFFNIKEPYSIIEEKSTGVYMFDTNTMDDDILAFSRKQLNRLGLNDKECFDLVMTHECAHRALQGLDTGYTPQQEELCCDFLSGVRASLNGMDLTKMEHSLENTSASSTHPDGADRVAAIEAGAKFANEYMENHHGISPTFSDCKMHFDELEGLYHQVNLSPERDFFGYYSKAYSGDSESVGSVGFADNSDNVFSKNYNDNETLDSIGYVDPNHKQDFIGPSFTGDSDSENIGSIGYVSENMDDWKEFSSENPSFHGSHIDGNGNKWSESEVKSKIHEAENKVHYYKSRIAERTNDMRGRTDPVKIKEIANDIRGFERDLDKWENIEKKWRNML